jgi:two-component system sensor histidine kinase KdpD
MVVISTGVAFVLQPILLPSNLSLAYLPAVLFVALRCGLWPSVLAAALGVLSWDFLFLPPRYQFRIDDPQDLLALILFLIVALSVSNVAAKQREQSEAMAARATATAQLYDFSQKIATVATLEDLLSVLTRTIGAMVSRDVFIMMPASGALQVLSGYPRKRGLTEAEWREADAAWNDAPVPSPTAPAFLALRTLRGKVGLLGLDRTPSWPLYPDELRMLSTLMDQAAVAIERMQLAETVDQARIEAETERLRSAMLTSVSHDLRTPLTVIIGAHSTIKSLGENCDCALRAELLDRAQDEAERLNRFIGNLLDMTMLESGRLNLKLEAVDLHDTIETALARASALTANHRIAIDLPDELPMPTADFMLLEQVVFNLLDNAAKYAPAQTTITLSGNAESGLVVLEIADEGEGLPLQATEMIFNKFARLERGDVQRPGTGLGLAICRGFLGAMGGTITAGNRRDRSGAVFTIRLPFKEDGTADNDPTASANANDGAFTAGAHTERRFVA